MESQMPRLTDELLDRLDFEYHAHMAATCQVDPPYGELLDEDKLDDFPTFYDYLLQLGYTQSHLSAYGIGRDIDS